MVKSLNRFTDDRTHARSALEDRLVDLQNAAEGERADAVAVYDHAGGTVTQPVPTLALALTREGGSARRARCSPFEATPWRSDYCGSTAGRPLGHSYRSLTAGRPLGHSYRRSGVRY